MKTKAWKAWILPVLIVLLLLFLPSASSEASGGEYLKNGAQIGARLKKMKDGESWTFVMTQDIVIKERLNLKELLKITIVGNGHTIRFEKNTGFDCMNSTLTFSGGKKSLTIVGFEGQDKDAPFYMNWDGKLILKNNVIIKGYKGNPPLIRLYDNSKLMVFNSRIEDCKTEQDLIEASLRSLVYMKGAEIRRNSNIMSKTINCDMSEVILFDTKIAGNISTFGTIYASGSESGNRSEVYLKNTILSDNFSYHRGGGITSYDSIITLEDSTIYHNSARVVAGGLLISPDSDLKLGGKVVIWKNKSGNNKELSSDVYLQKSGGERTPVILFGRLSKGSLIGVRREDGTGRITFGYRKAGNKEHPSRFLVPNDQRLLVCYSFNHPDIMQDANLEEKLPAIDRLEMENTGYGSISLKWFEYPGTFFRVYRKIGNGPAKLIYSGHAKLFEDKTASATEVNYYCVLEYVYDFDGTLLCGLSSPFHAIRANKLAKIDAVYADYDMEEGTHLSWSAINGADGYLIYRRKEDGEFLYTGMTKGTRFLDKELAGVRYLDCVYHVYGYKKLKDGSMVLSVKPAEVAVNIVAP